MMIPQFEYVLYDIEGNGLYNEVTRLWCAVLIDLPTGVVKGYRPDELDKFAEDLKKAKVRVGHNIVDYDDPVMTKFFGYKLDLCGAVDTLVWSRLFYPDRPGGHSLRSWGIRLGCHKGDFSEFHQFSEEMYTYCLQDGEVNYTLIKHFLKGLGWTWDDLVRWCLEQQEDY